MDRRPRRDGDLLRDPRRGAVTAAALLMTVAAMALLVTVETTSPPILDGLDARW